jgi:hypothetical protein
MNSAQRNELLSKWIQPSSANEQLQQERAERMVNEAIAAWPAFDDISVKAYAKGSYPNNTNVRYDSDVDIVVECHEVFFYDDIDVYGMNIAPYDGPWGASTWRTEVVAAMCKKFGTSSIDTSGKIAIEISAVPGSRPSIDVVPSFLYRQYKNFGQVEEGSCVYTTDLNQVVNWPNQQLTNGKSKNTITGGRYKRFVRALKNAENTLVDTGAIAPMPSYFMECLVWNVPNNVLQHGDLEQGFRESLAVLYRGVTDIFVRNAWSEPNMIKPLFDEQKWTPEDAEKLLIETWNYLDYE